MFKKSITSFVLAIILLLGVLGYCSATPVNDDIAEYRVEYKALLDVLTTQVERLDGLQSNLDQGKITPGLETRRAWDQYKSIYMAVNGQEKVWNRAQQTVARNHPNDPMIRKMLAFDKGKYTAKRAAYDVKYEKVGEGLRNL
ncbi:hypothetical protein K7432_000821 [Basidiobolus ranarum]|uniref:Uncharacterized protein n=1 Tax=Basidiobolus ranarum TaxID=34480 RepID=A0ABR2X3Z0_9FUNG